MKLVCKLSLTILISMGRLGISQLVLGLPAWSRPDPDGGSNNLASAAVPASRIDAPTFPVHSMLTPSSMVNTDSGGALPASVVIPGPEPSSESTASASSDTLVAVSHQVVPSALQSTFNFQMPFQSFVSPTLPLMSVSSNDETNTMNELPLTGNAVSRDSIGTTLFLSRSANTLPMCTQTVIVFDIVTVHAGCSGPCGYSSATPTIDSMTAGPSNRPGGTSRAASVQSSIGISASGQQTVETASGSQAAIPQMGGQLSQTTSPFSGSSQVLYSVPMIQSISISNDATVQTAPSPYLSSAVKDTSTSSRSSFTLVAMPSPSIPIESTMVEATITTSSSTPVRTTFATTAGNLPATTVLSSLLEVSNHAHSSSSSAAAAVTSKPPSQSTVQSAALSEESGGAGCTSVPTGARPSPAYTNPQNGLMYRIQCGTTLELVQQCPYLCSEGGGGLFRQCERNDESGTDGQSGVPVICQQCLPPCGSSNSARVESEPQEKEVEQAIRPQAKSQGSKPPLTSYLGALGRLGFYPQWTANLVRALTGSEKINLEADKVQGKRSPKVVTLSRPRVTVAK